MATDTKWLENEFEVGEAVMPYVTGEKHVPFTDSYTSPRYADKPETSHPSDYSAPGLSYGPSNLTKLQIWRCMLRITSSMSAATPLVAALTAP